MNVFSAAVRGQYEAALRSLADCAERCPEAEWNEARGDYPFCQVVFHALFFADYYLDEGPAAFRAQAFHAARRDFFRDYEELENRPARNLYGRQSCLEYARFCRDKARAVLALQDAEALASRTPIPGKSWTRLELHLDNLRHIQHHAAQLSLRLQLLGLGEARWIGSGWPEA